MPRNFDFKNACSQPCRTEAEFEGLQARVQEKGHGWMVPLLMEMDAKTHRRWQWWAPALETRKIPEGPIPQISFESDGSRGVAETQRMISWCLDGIQCGDRKEALRYLIAWLAWSLGIESEMPDGTRVDKHASAILYQRFVLDMFVVYPFDHLGDALCEAEHGQGKRSNAFYPTPMSLVVLMSGLTYGMQDSEQTKLKPAYDPTMGTGRTLLVASNHSLFLYGQDIDALVLSVAKINFMIYAPWGMCPLKPSEIEEKT